MVDAERAELAALKTESEIETDDDLWNWIVAFTGFKIPRTAVVEGHRAPFDFVADCYFDRVPKAILVGPRGGGKTLITAILSYAELIRKEGVEVASVAAIFKQAKRLDRYIGKFTKDDLETQLLVNRTMDATDFTNGSRLEILTGKTEEAVNSPHPHRCNIDEFELMDWDVLNEAFMMPKATPTQPSSLRLLSTRKRIDGNVQKLMDDADAQGWEVYKFCALDIAERCTFEERPTCDGCKQIIRYDQQNDPVSFYEICQERLRNANGFYLIPSLIEEFQTIDVDKYLTQKAPCSKPARGDACFDEYKEELHFVDGLDFSPDFPIGAGWDFGLKDPTYVVVFQWDSYGQAWTIDEIGTRASSTSPKMRKGMVADVCAELLTRPYAEALLTSGDHWCDPAGRQRGTYMQGKLDRRSAFDILRKHGFRPRFKRRPNPGRRIQAVKTKLRRDEDLGGEPGLLISKKCRRLGRALEMAQWDEKRENYVHDEHSHPLDAIGYAVDALWPVVKITSEAKA